MKENIISFIKFELLGTKIDLVQRLKDIKGKTNIKNVEKRIVKLVKAIELLDKIDLFNEVYFEEKNR